MAVNVTDVNNMSRAETHSLDLGTIVIVVAALVGLLFVVVIIIVVRACVLCGRKSSSPAAANDDVEMDGYDDPEYASVGQRNGNLYLQTIEKEKKPKRKKEKKTKSGSVYSTTIERDDSTKSTKKLTESEVQPDGAFYSTSIEHENETGSDGIARDKEGNVIYAQVSRRGKTGNKYKAAAENNKRRKVSTNSEGAPDLPTRNYTKSS